MPSTALNYQLSELTELKLRPGITTIGSAADNDIIISGPDVSAYHAKIVTYFHMALLVDLSSSTGTFLNGHRIIKHSVKKGDTLRLGEHEFLIGEISSF